MPSTLLRFYGLDKDQCIVSHYGNGLINNTWKIICGDDEFILQRINQNVFKNPLDLIENIRKLSAYFEKVHPDYFFVAPRLTLKKQDFVFDPEKGYFRLFPFVKGSYTCDTVAKSSLAFEAAKQFGRFTKMLSGFRPSHLRITLPDFHNLTLRHEQFESAIREGNPERIMESEKSIEFLQQHKGITEIFEKIKTNPNFILRVTHHDTKISNVLFSREKDLGLCVIDLDTVMPGYFISDVGDMLRTYLSPVSEEEKDYSKIEIREDYFTAIARGYLGEMQYELSEDEKEHFVYAGKFIIYMQAIRFLTDYLNNDLYYGSKYEGHNFVRANNQIVLLKRLMEKEDKLLEKLKPYLNTRPV
ncbi:MAG: aminoglycoside phosphotransferase family protein [Bacteroidota bacterium]|nr:aminoglycoside phosphotransferase family protein [Bacteroidota bacterium]MDP4212475.1 aminoglycoside phosphotransferase family protein [Bacteroidota bacterium]MDP4248951.1 aminoglycoside phosphotransferase family protein [Bacteroidota bacterium]